jgi:DNA invertase Pin-like site-specific DNA recombinase
MASPPARRRCAIYTRKSTEEGLDQAFNSLDAQREACAAYVMSQQHEGWTLLPDRYDDGGYSGGTIERPALQQLMAGVKAGNIDVVVVYKIDRLTRSLTDFAKFVEVFDTAECSFVSVTQAFNTTNSMGRLTLNVLLSFAQFEREVIAERVRDKVAASKAKGIWMGGQVPLGYTVKNRKLVVVPDEAATVRHIMARYLRAESVHALAAELERDGIVSKLRTMRDGSTRGGVPFKRGALAWLLSNRTYVGETTHKGKFYPGEHEAIVERELFDKVQAKLAERTNLRAHGASPKVVSLLAGMIRDDRDRPMSPSHSYNHGRRYRYYVSNLNADRAAPALRLPAGELDAAVRQKLSEFLLDSGRTRELAASVSTDDLLQFVERCGALAHRVSTAAVAELRSVLQALDTSVSVRPSGITLSFCSGALLEHLGLASSDARRVELGVPTHQASFGHEARLRLDPGPGLANPTDQRLLEVLARAFEAREQLLAMSEADAANTPMTRLRHLQRIARLSYLEPAIVRSILAGSQPSHLSPRTLWRQASLPVSWAEQRSALRIAAI